MKTTKNPPTQEKKSMNKHKHTPIQEMINKYLKGLVDFQNSIDDRIQREREMIAEHEENIRSLESQRAKPL